MSRIAPETRTRAKELRANPTEAEKRVWRRLREVARATSLHFRRQAPIGPYIADFAELSQQLVIEIDGGQHRDDADAARTTWLESQGFRVLRFWNSDVAENLDGVINAILDAVENSNTAPTTNASPPPCGEGLGVGALASRQEHPIIRLKEPTNE